MKLSDDGEGSDAGDSVSGGAASDSSSSTESADNHSAASHNGGGTRSSGGQAFRRPARPALLKNGNRSQQSSREMQMRRRRSKYAAQHEAKMAAFNSGDEDVGIQVGAGCHAAATARDPWNLPIVPSSQESNPTAAANGPPAAASVYFRRHRDTLIEVNSQPVGFDSSLAAAAVAKSRQMRLNGGGFPRNGGFGASANGEEYFGSSESESDQDLK